MRGAHFKALLSLILVFSLNLSSVWPAFAGGAQSRGYELIENDLEESTFGTVVPVSQDIFPWEQLPVEIQKEIVKFFDADDIPNALRVSKQFYELAKPLLWNHDVSGKDFSSLVIPSPKQKIICLSNINMTPGDFHWILCNSGFRSVWLDSVSFKTSGKDKKISSLKLSKNLTHLKITNSTLDPVATELAIIIRDYGSLKLFDVGKNSMAYEGRKLIQETVLNDLYWDDSLASPIIKPITISLPYDLNAPDVDNDEVIRIGKIKNRSTSLISHTEVKMQNTPSNLELFKAQDRVDSPKGCVNCICNKTFIPYAQCICGFDVCE